MKTNIGKIDKVIRIFFAIIISGLYLEGQISGFGAVLLVLIAVLFFITGFFSFCPLYYLLGISTEKKRI
ncbi:MAG TPA: DUF2892 domain-containing protein [Ignavibacteria bacterium]|nr:DUF2892 domain-containing protein [Ignavibacteria bacterium]